MEPCVGGKRKEYCYADRSGVAIEKDHRILVLIIGCVNVAKWRIDFFSLWGEIWTKQVRKRRAGGRDHRRSGPSRKIHPVSDLSRKSSQVKDSLLPNDSTAKIDQYHRTDADCNLRLRR